MTIIINADTVWTAGSAHALGGGVVQIAPGATLTIEPGAVVSGGTIEAYGRLNVDGATGDLVELQDVTLRVKGDAGHLDLDHTHMIGGSLHNPTGWADYANLTLTNSIFEGLTGYTYIWYPKAPVLVEGNLFLRSGGFSVGTSGVSITFRNNTFVEQTGSFAIVSWNGTPLVTGNSFLSTDRVALAIEYGNYTGAFMAAEGNYFGTTDSAVIDGMVRDRTDSLAYNSVVDVTPFLTAPDPNAPTLASLSIAALNASHAEGTGTSAPFTFIVARSGSTATAVSAAWAVSGDGANPASATDFVGGVLPSGTVSFAAGETTKTISLSIAPDTLVEGNERFKVTLSDPTGGAVLGTATALGTIQNDDVTGPKPIVGTVKANTLNGTALADLIQGLGGNDKLYGKTGDDRLEGGGGNDLLQGDAGADTLVGGKGADTFAFKTMADSVPGAMDLILDFARADKDKLDLKGIDANPGKSGDQAFSFVGTASFSKVGQVHYALVNGDTRVELNLDADRDAEMVFSLDMALALKSSDFVL